MVLSGIMATVMLMQANVPKQTNLEDTCYKVSASDYWDNWGMYVSAETGIDLDYVDYAIESGVENNIAPALIVSIIKYESGGNPNIEASSGSGAIGLCQIKPEYQKDRCKELKVTSLYDPKDNIKVCADYLLELFDKYEDVCLVMTAYRYGDSSTEFKYAQTTGYIYPYVKNVVGLSDKLQEAL